MNKVCRTRPYHCMSAIYSQLKYKASNLNKQCDSLAVKETQHIVLLRLAQGVPSICDYTLREAEEGVIQNKTNAGLILHTFFFKFAHQRIKFES